eukprot:4291512-Prymnesium_polylepis.1
MPGPESAAIAQAVTYACERGQDTWRHPRPGIRRSMRLLIHQRGAAPHGALEQSIPRAMLHPVAELIGLVVLFAAPVVFFEKVLDGIGPSLRKVAHLFRPDTLEVLGIFTLMVVISAFIVAFDCSACALTTR